MTMATMAAGVLLSSETHCLKPFWVNGIAFNPVDLQTIGFNVLMGYNPTVKYNSNLKHSYYNSGSNELWFKFNSATSVMEKSIVVHEATHAACDMNRAKMTIADSEVMAYLAQAQFAYANNPYPDKRYLQGQTWQSDNVFKIAWLLAGDILDGGSISSNEISNLRSAIYNNPTYGSAAAATAGYAGI